MKTTSRHSSVRAAAALVVAGALVSPLVASAQSSSGPILGFYKMDIPANSSLWVCGLVKKKDHQGQMDGLTTGVQSVITENDRTFAVNEFGNHYIKILSGPWTGLVLDVISNGANTITVEGDLSVFGLAGDEAFCIREHVTLGDMLPGGGGLANQFGDSLKLYYSNGSSRTFLFGDIGGPQAQWFDPSTFAIADDEPVYPGQGFVISAASSATLLIGQNGVSYVEDTRTLVPLYAGSVNLVGLINPLVATDPLDPIFPSQTTLGEMEFASQIALFEDTVSIFGRTGSLSPTGSYLAADLDGDGGDPPFMFNPGDFANADAVPVEVGSAVVISVSADRYYDAPVLHPVN